MSVKSVYVTSPSFRFDQMRGPEPIDVRQFETAFQMLSKLRTEIDLPDNYSRAPQVPIATSSLLRRLDR